MGLATLGVVTTEAAHLSVCFSVIRNGSQIKAQIPKNMVLFAHPGSLRLLTSSSRNTGTAACCESGMGSYHCATNINPIHLSTSFLEVVSLQQTPQFQTVTSGRF